MAWKNSTSSKLCLTMTKTLAAKVISISSFFASLQFLSWKFVRGTNSKRDFFSSKFTVTYSILRGFAKFAPIKVGGRPLDPERVWDLNLNLASLQLLRLAHSPFLQVFAKWLRAPPRGRGSGWRRWRSRCPGRTRRSRSWSHHFWVGVAPSCSRFQLWDFSNRPTLEKPRNVLIPRHRGPLLVLVFGSCPNGTFLGNRFCIGLRRRKSTFLGRRRQLVSTLSVQVWFS